MGGPSGVLQPLADASESANQCDLGIGTSTERGVTVSQISKISLSATKATQASLCSLSTVDQIANLLPSVQSRAMRRLA